MLLQALLEVEKSDSKFVLWVFFFLLFVDEASPFQMFQMFSMASFPHGYLIVM